MLVVSSIRFQSAMDSVGPCDNGSNPRILSVRSLDRKRAITICLQYSAILPLLCLITLIQLQIGNFIWGFLTFRDQNKCSTATVLKGQLPGGDGSYQGESSYKSSWKKWRGLILTLSAMYPIFYNHDMLFMYFNDQWYDLLAVQIFFTFTDDLCLLLRWNKNSYPELGFFLRGLHIFFNIAVERKKFGPRNLIFLLDDLVSIVDLAIITPEFTVATCFAKYNIFSSGNTRGIFTVGFSTFLLILTYVNMVKIT